MHTFHRLQSALACIVLAGTCFHAARAAGASSADAPPAPALQRFGAAGTTAISGALSAGIGHLGYSSGPASSTNLGVDPALDYFVARNVSLGGALSVRYADDASALGLDVKSWTLGVTGHVGVNLWLGDRVSFWAKLDVGVARSWSNYSGGPPGPTVLGGGNSFFVSMDGKAVLVNTSDFKEDVLFTLVYAPVLFHVTNHLFVGFGPNAYVDLLHSVHAASVEVASNRRFFIGAASTVGGWF